MIKKPAILHGLFYAFGFSECQSLYQRGLPVPKPEIEPELLGCEVLKIDLLSEVKNVTRRIELRTAIEINLKLLNFPWKNVQNIRGIMASLYVRRY